MIATNSAFGSQSTPLLHSYVEKVNENKYTEPLGVLGSTNGKCRTISKRPRKLLAKTRSICKGYLCGKARNVSGTDVSHPREQTADTKVSFLTEIDSVKSERRNSRNRIIASSHMKGKPVMANTPCTRRLQEESVPISYANLFKESHQPYTKRSELERSSEASQTQLSHQLGYIKPVLQLNVRMDGATIHLSWSFNQPSGPDTTFKRFVLFSAVTDNVVPPMHGSEWIQIGVVDTHASAMLIALKELYRPGKYHFSLLAVDSRGNPGPLSNPCTVSISERYFA